MYPKENRGVIFCKDCWYGDSWDPLSYGMDYDFSRPFLEQLNDLVAKVPKLNLYQRNSVNSDFTNVAIDSKNVFLSYSVVIAEDVFYSKNVDRSKKIIDCLCISDCENSAYLVYGGDDYNVVYSVMTRACLDSMFLYDCSNCSNCFMSSNLRNQKYVFRNKKYNKEDYEKLVAEANTGSYQNFIRLVKEFEEMKRKAIHKYADIIKSTDSSGHALSLAKNAKSCFEAYDLEDVKFVARVFALKDSYDTNNAGLGSELVCEYISGGTKMSRVMFSLYALTEVHDMEYSHWCGNAGYLFGCVGLRNKQYCILNKQYTKEEYEKLVPKIREHMSAMPYVSAKGRIYPYGEFFPVEMSPFAYNESSAQELFPLTEKEIKDKGYVSKPKEAKKNQVTKDSESLPDHIEDTDPSIVEEIFGCPDRGECIHQCTTAYRITKEEFTFYKMHNLPLPRFCPNCRFFKRMEYRNPWKLWQRQCMCEKKHSNHKGVCGADFETSYAPDRPETIYCEKCYQQEVY